MFNSTRLIPEFDPSHSTIDWRIWGVVRPVQDSGKCAGDYAFSTTAVTETAFAIKTGKLYDLSEQYLLDCDV